jgi:hypothetical protein
MINKESFFPHFVRRYLPTRKTVFPAYRRDADVRAPLLDPWYVVETGTLAIVK